MSPEANTALEVKKVNLLGGSGLKAKARMASGS